MATKKYVRVQRKIFAQRKKANNISTNIQSDKLKVTYQITMAIHMI